jgi:exodeoxyribonuclease VII small subunit
MTHHHDALSFEDALTQLQDVVNRLETANLSLDQTIDDFRRGTELAAYCQRLIAEAELKVTELVSASS